MNFNPSFNNEVKFSSTSVNIPTENKPNSEVENKANRVCQPLLSNGTFQVQLPGRENLLQRWENLRKDCNYLPPLSISSSEGIASDDKFMDSYIKHDFLLSTGEEFFHEV
jgi:hypothetical protein